LGPAGGGGGDLGPGGGGGAAFPGAGGRTEAEARPNVSARAAIVETILDVLRFVGRGDNIESSWDRTTLHKCWNSASYGLSGFPSRTGRESISTVLLQARIQQS